MAALLRILACAVSLAVAACATAPPSTAPEIGSGRGPVALRSLVVMLDGVPFEVMDSLWRAGHFSGFRPPSRVVSPFPALTQVAFGSIWREPPSAGYEDRYFDVEENRIEGGLLDHLFQSGEHGGFQRHVEVKAGALVGGLAYLVPEPFAGRELRSIRREIEERAAFDTAIVAYVVSTDAIAHRAGRDELVAYLLEVDQVLGELRSRFGPGLQISLFSDHGNELVPTQRVPLERALEAAGFHIAGRIDGPRDVVVPGFGLVGSAFVYTATHAEPEVARVLAGVPGVDLVLYEDGRGDVRVQSARGSALIRADSAASRIRYAPLDGDPLFLAEGMVELRRNGTMDDRGFAPDTAWLRVSLATPYIDSLRRVVLGVRGRVQFPANVLVSFDPGYHYGSKTADFLVDVTGTHGSLRTGSALAFLMTTHTHAPSLVRSEQLMLYLQAVLR